MAGGESAFSNASEHSTLANTRFKWGNSSIIDFAKINPVISARRTRPLLSTITARSPSPSKPTPKSAFSDITFLARNLSDFSFGSELRFGNVGSTLQNKGMTFSPIPRRIVGAERHEVPFPQSTTTFIFRFKENFDVKNSLYFSLRLVTVIWPTLSHLGFMNFPSTKISQILSLSSSENPVPFP